MQYTYMVDNGLHSVEVLGRIGDTLPGLYNFNDEALASDFIVTLAQQGYKRVLTDGQKEQLIADWNNADQQQRYWKDRENALRAQLVEVFYTKEKGTENVPLRGEWTLKIERGEDYKLENKNNETDKALENFTEVEADMLVVWKPEIVKRNFDALTDEAKAHFNGALTIKPSSPQVKLLPPKVKVS